MKKWLILILSAVVMFSVCACSNSDTRDLTSSTNTVSDILAQGGAVTETQAASVSSKSSSAELSTDVDVDLTALSATMTFSEVQNMMISPEDYLGKSVRMAGSFAVAEDNGNRYFACIIRDATACCSNGIEFLWEGEHSYPEDYPEQGSEITVVGIFNTYYEGSQMYLQLTSAELSF